MHVWGVGVTGVGVIACGESDDPLDRDGLGDACRLVDARTCQVEVVERRGVGDLDGVCARRESHDRLPIWEPQPDLEIVVVADAREQVRRTLRARVALAGIALRLPGSRDRGDHSRDHGRDQHTCQATVQAPIPLGGHSTPGIRPTPSSGFRSGGGTSDSAPKVDA